MQQNKGLHAHNLVLSPPRSHITGSRLKGANMFFCKEVPSTQKIMHILIVEKIEMIQLFQVRIRYTIFLNVHILDFYKTTNLNSRSRLFTETLAETIV